MSVMGVVKQIHDAVKSKKIDEAVALINQIRTVHPDSWTHLLFAGNVIPEPGSPNFEKEVEVILDVMGKLISNSVAADKIEGVLDIMMPLGDLGTVFSYISNRLDQLESWEAPYSKAVYRMAAFLEDQARLVNVHIASKTSDDAYLNPLSAEDDILPATIGQGGVIPITYEHTALTASRR